jgi:hypothetical protein
MGFWIFYSLETVVVWILSIVGEMDNIYLLILFNPMIIVLKLVDYKNERLISSLDDILLKTVKLLALLSKKTTNMSLDELYDECKEIEENAEEENSEAIVKDKIYKCTIPCEDTSSKAIDYPLEYTDETIYALRNKRPTIETVNSVLTFRFRSGKRCKLEYASCEIENKDTGLTYKVVDIDSLKIY